MPMRNPLPPPPGPQMLPGPAIPPDQVQAMMNGPMGAAPPGPPPGPPPPSIAGPEVTPRAPWWAHLITPGIGLGMAALGHGGAGLALAAGGARGSEDYFNSLAAEDRKKREDQFKVSLQKSENLSKRVEELRQVSQLAAQKGVHDNSLNMALDAYNQAIMSTGPGGKAITDAEMDKVNNALLGINEAALRKAAGEYQAEQTGQLNAQTEAAKLGMPAAAYQEQERRQREYEGTRLPFSQQKGQPQTLLSPKDWAAATGAEMKGMFTPYQQAQVGLGAQREHNQDEVNQRMALVAEQQGILAQLAEKKPPRRYVTERKPLEDRLQEIRKSLSGLQPPPSPYRGGQGGGVLPPPPTPPERRTVNGITYEKVQGGWQQVQ